MLICTATAVSVVNILIQKVEGGRRKKKIMRMRGRKRMIMRKRMRGVAVGSPGFYRAVRSG